MKGTNRRFPRERILVLDVIRASRSVPSFPVERRIDLGSIEKALLKSPTRFSWATLFAKAWGLVSVEIPQLREAYLRWPNRRLYRHPNSVVTITVHRDDSPLETGELIWCRIQGPENLSLLDIQGELDRFRQGPIDRVFQDGKRLSRLPTMVRNRIWDLLMNTWGRKKAKKLGTFSISSLADQNALNRFHPLIVTTSISYSRIDPSGNCLFTLLCDHRVLDGVLAARALNRLEKIMQFQIREELE